MSEDAAYWMAAAARWQENANAALAVANKVTTAAEQLKKERDEMTALAFQLRDVAVLLDGQVKEALATIRKLQDDRTELLATIEIMSKALGVS